MLDPNRNFEFPKFEHDDANIFLSEFLMGSLFVFFFLM